MLSKILDETPFYLLSLLLSIYSYLIFVFYLVFIDKTLHKSEQYLWAYFYNFIQNYYLTDRQEKKLKILT